MALLVVEVSWAMQRARKGTGYCRSVEAEQKDGRFYRYWLVDEKATGVEKLDQLSDIVN